MNAKGSQGGVQMVTCSFPTPEHPCYHARLFLETPGQKDYQVQRVEANGKWVRDFRVYNDATYHKDKTFLADARSSIVVRHDWQNGSANHLEIRATDEGGEEITLSAEFTAPDYGGYWDPAWKYYASVVLTENDGWPRVEQPYRYMHWGPWTYCARPLIYTFATDNPQRVIRAPGGSTYYEKMAFLPFRLGSNEASRFEAIERRQQALSHPLDIRVVLDTDERVPEEWIPP